jgi:hypothetical protein
MDGDERRCDMAMAQPSTVAAGNDRDMVYFLYLRALLLLK